VEIAAGQDYGVQVGSERDIFSLTPDQEAAADQRAEADIAAGRGVSHDDVVAWLKTWGTPQDGPPPPEWLE
jgi:predicted transcriptional regulator